MKKGLKSFRDQWPGKLVLKGVASEEDTEKAIALGVDGIIVSNHGGRQLDADESTIKPLSEIAKKYKGKIKVMMDSGMAFRAGCCFLFSQWRGVYFYGPVFYVWGSGAWSGRGGSYNRDVENTITTGDGTDWL